LNLFFVKQANVFAKAKAQNRFFFYCAWDGMGTPKAQNTTTSWEVELPW
jgi:hypothetical protein